MSNLTEFAERELREAGWFDDGDDGMYYGEIGPAVLALVRVFAEQGHSGGSAQHVVEIFRRLASWQPINPLKNPTETGEYIVHDEDPSAPVYWQSTRKSSVFSSDGGKTWCDINTPVPWWKRIVGVRRIPISF